MTDLAAADDEVVPLDARIIHAVVEPIDFPIASLDAIHHVTAIAYRAQRSVGGRELMSATHDMQLAASARAVGADASGA